MLSPIIKLSIASELLSLNDEDLVLVHGIIIDIKSNEYKKELYSRVENLDNEEVHMFRGGSNMLFINTTNPLKKRAINRVLNINDDKLEEIINIIDMLNADEIKAKDIKDIKFYLFGYLEEKFFKKNSKENHIKSTYDQEEKLNYLATLVEVLDNIDNR